MERKRNKKEEMNEQRKDRKKERMKTKGSKKIKTKKKTQQTPKQIFFKGRSKRKQRKKDGFSEINEVSMIICCRITVRCIYNYSLRELVVHTKKSNLRFYCLLMQVSAGH